MEIEANMEADIYSEDGLDFGVDDDEISSAEAGFMKGYDEAYIEDEVV